MDQPTFAVPLEVPVPLRAGEIVVRSACMGPLLQAKEKLLPVLELLAREAPGLFDRERLELIAETKTLTANDITDLCLLLERADVAVDLVAVLAPMPRDQVLQLMPDEYFFLFAVVVQVNADFFGRALPVLKAAWQRVAALAPAAAASGTSS